MRTKLVLAMATVLLAATAAHAQNTKANLDRAKNTVNNIRQADPPKVSTGTVVQPIARPPQQMPRGGSDIHRMKTNPPPSPVVTKKK